MARTWMYSKQVPKGRIFDLDKVALKELEAKGWVDSPVKIGKTKPETTKRGKRAK